MRVVERVWLDEVVEGMSRDKVLESKSKGKFDGGMCRYVQVDGRCCFLFKSCCREDAVSGWDDVELEEGLVVDDSSMSTSLRWNKGW